MYRRLPRQGLRRSGAREGGRGNAEKLQGSLDELDAAGQSDCDRIIADAKQQAQELSGAAKENERLRQNAQADSASSYEQMCLRYAEALQCRGRTGADRRRGDIARQQRRKQKDADRPLYRGASRKAGDTAQRPREDASGEKLVTISGGEELSAADAEKIGKVIEDNTAMTPWISALKETTPLSAACGQRGRLRYNATLQHQLSRVKKIVAETEDAGDVMEVFKKTLANAPTDIDSYQTGRVISLSDGICRVSGLSDVMSGELLEFRGDLRGMVMDLECDNVGVVLLGNYDNVQEGDEVRRTGRIIEVPSARPCLAASWMRLAVLLTARAESTRMRCAPSRPRPPASSTERAFPCQCRPVVKAIDALHTHRPRPA